MKRTQFGWLTVAILIAINVILFFQISDINIAMLISAISVLCIMLFYKLTITVSDKDVQFSFGIGLIKGSYLLSNIIECKSIRYTPLGWGIRFRPGAILYNVSGNKAIELKIKNKKWKVWIGTNVPDEIANYINSLR